MKGTISFSENKDLPRDEVLNLYNDAEWYAYTKEPEVLMEAISNSIYVRTAWENETLVGLIRVIGDGKTIIYIQDILILKSHKRRGIGSQLISTVMEKYGDVRQKVLLTDDNPETRGFYEAIGFESCDKGQTVAFGIFG